MAKLDNYPMEVFRINQIPRKYDCVCMPDIDVSTFTSYKGEAGKLTGYLPKVIVRR